MPHQIISVKTGILIEFQSFPRKKDMKHMADKPKAAQPKISGKAGSVNGNWIRFAKNRSQKKTKAIPKVNCIIAHTRNQIFVNFIITPLVILILSFFVFVVQNPNKSFVLTQYLFTKLYKYFVLTQNLLNCSHIIQL